MSEVMEIEARIKDLISGELKNITKVMEDTARKGEDTSKRNRQANDMVSKSVMDLKSSWNIASIAAGSFVGAMGAMSVLNTVKNFLIGVRNETKEYYASQLRLNASLGYTSNALSQQAEILQDRLKIDDDITRGIQTTISYFTKDENKIKELTQATLNFSAATGIDANSAAMLLSRAIEGSTMGLSRYGIKIQDATNDLGRIDNIIAAVNGRFGGQAEALAKSRDAWDGLSLSIKDAQKSIGLFMDKSFGIGNTKLSDRSKEFAETLIKTSTDSDKAIVQSDDEKNKQRDANFKNFMKNYFTGLKEQNAVTIKLQEELWKQTEEGQIKILNKQMATELSKTTLTEEQKNLIRQRYAVQIDKIQESIDQKELARQRNLNSQMEQIVAKNAQKDIEENKFKLEQAKITTDELNRLEETRIQGISNTYQRDNELLKLKQKKELAEFDGNEAAKKIVEQRHVVERSNLDKKQIEDRKKDDKKLTDKKIENQEFAADSSFKIIRNLAAASKASSAIQKTIDIGQATANVALAVTKALATPGGKWQIPWIVALGATQVAAIAAAKYQGGGIVPGNGKGDTVPSMLTPGEMILNMGQQTELFKLLNRPSSVSNTANSFSSSVNSPIAVNINVGSGGNYDLRAATMTVDSLVPLLGDALVKAQREGRLHQYETAR